MFFACALALDLDPASALGYDLLVFGCAIALAYRALYVVHARPCDGCGLWADVRAMSGDVGDGLPRALSGGLSPGGM